MRYLGRATSQVFDLIVHDIILTTPNCEHLDGGGKIRVLNDEMCDGRERLGIHTLSGLKDQAGGHQGLRDVL